jgi:hypothetical protein
VGYSPLFYIRTKLLSAGFQKLEAESPSEPTTPMCAVTYKVKRSSHSLQTKLALHPVNVLLHPWSSVELSGEGIVNAPSRPQREEVNNGHCAFRQSHNRSTQRQNIRLSMQLQKFTSIAVFGLTE